MTIENTPSFQSTESVIITNVFSDEGIRIGKEVARKGCRVIGINMPGAFPAIDLSWLDELLITDDISAMIEAAKSRDYYRVINC